MRSKRLTFAFRKIVESWSTLVTVETGVVGFAGTLTAPNLTHFVPRPVVVAVTRLAQGEAVVSAATPVVGWV